MAKFRINRNMLEEKLVFPTYLTDTLEHTYYILETPIKDTAFIWRSNNFDMRKTKFGFFNAMQNEKDNHDPFSDDEPGFETTARMAPNVCIGLLC
jgi:hypothetical protein